MPGSPTTPATWPRPVSTGRAGRAGARAPAPAPRTGLAHAPRAPTQAHVGHDLRERCRPSVALPVLEAGSRHGFETRHPPDQTRECHYTGSARALPAPGAPWPRRPRPLPRWTAPYRPVHRPPPPSRYAGPCGTPRALGTRAPGAPGAPATADGVQTRARRGPGVILGWPAPQRG